MTRFVRRRCEPAVRLARDGHTLWEMLLVLSLMGMLVALVAPAAPVWRMAGRDEASVDRVALDLEKVLSSARLAAMARGETVQVVLDPSAGRVWTFATSQGATHESGRGMLDLPPGVLLATADARLVIRFAPDGTSSGGRVLLRSGSEHRAVTVDRWSGVASAE